MNEYLEKAKELLEEQSKKSISGNAGVIMPYVKGVLIQFAEQEPEFAQAIVQSTGTLAECCRECAKHIDRNHCSDKEVYKSAAQYYFPGSDVEFKMTIQLCEADKEAIVIDLSEFC